jgi:hypothetical protein
MQHYLIIEHAFISLENVKDDIHRETREVRYLRDSDTVSMLIDDLDDEIFHLTHTGTPGRLFAACAANFLIARAAAVWLSENA